MISVYSNNVTQAQYGLHSRVSDLISASVYRVSSYADVTGYIQGPLHESFESADALTAQAQLEQNPDLVLPMYYRLVLDEQLKLMGAAVITEIAIPSTFKAPCSPSPLFDKLNISCMSQYEVSTPGRLIRGTEATYSVGDGTSTLVYDFSTYSPSTNSRMISIEINVFDTVSASIAIAQIIFERSRLGNLKPKVSVVTIPQHFVYFGGLGTMVEWLLVGGLCFIALVSLVVILTILIRRIRRRSLAAPAIWEVTLLVIASMCVASCAVQFSAIMSNPLADINIGLKRSVALSEIADQFTAVNGINAVIIMTLFGLFLTDSININTLADWGAVVGVCLLIMTALAAILNLRFADCLSFSSSFVLLTKIGIRYVSTNDFAFLWQNGFAMASLMVFHAFVLYWVTGVVIGVFLGDKPKRSAPAFDLQNPLDTQEPNEEQTIASVEVFAGKMLGDVTAMKEQIENELGAARAELVETKAKVGGIRELVARS
jgi:hypothetical protein